MTRKPMTAAPEEQSTFEPPRTRTIAGAVPNLQERVSRSAAALSAARSRLGPISDRCWDNGWPNPWLNDV